ncbi:type II secretion system protein [Candidatus Daviesbacteria bacterium]|nr:type II secretion system protein [Candidatus Daviesbacteria bacterium]
MRKYLPQKGFTLIEILVALTIVAILAVAVYVALNPAQRLKDAKDARRATDVDTILTAIHQSIVDSKGTLPTNMPASGTEKQLGTGAVGDCPAAVGSKCSGLVTGCADLLTGGQNVAKYLKDMPSDPDTTDSPPLSTGYSVTVDANNIVTIKACYTDGTTAISASR